MTGNNSRSSLVMGLVLGAAVGAAAALLFAPTTGKKSREVVRQKTGKIAGAVKNRLKRTPLAMTGDHEEQEERSEMRA